MAVGTAPALAVSAPARLRVEALSKSYGGLRAVADLSFSADAGEVLGIVGPNGAGKTTLFDVITGLIRATGGRVMLDDEDITDASVPRRCHLGVGRTFQVPTVAASLTVYENVVVGCHYGESRDHWHGLPDGDHDHTVLLLELVGLLQRADHLAGPLGVFDKKRLMLASALAGGPRVLLLDEPFGGLNPAEIEETIALVRSIRQLGVAVVCIEHVMRALVQIADRVLVMHHGAGMFEGTPSEMLSDAEVREVYLGQRRHVEPGGDGEQPSGT
jgi:branched-chain amino acid transport system ATP-binding protein